MNRIEQLVARTEAKKQAWAAKGREEKEFNEWWQARMVQVKPEVDNFLTAYRSLHPGRLESHYDQMLMPFFSELIRLLYMTKDSTLPYIARVSLGHCSKHARMDAELVEKARAAVEAITTTIVAPIVISVAVESYITGDYSGDRREYELIVTLHA
jgi:hypothetical protein